MVRNSIVLISLIFLVGCAVQYEVVGQFTGYNEVFRGTVVNDLSTGEG